MIRKTMSQGRWAAAIRAAAAFAIAWSASIQAPAATPPVPTVRNVFVDVPVAKYGVPQQGATPAAAFNCSIAGFRLPLPHARYGPFMEVRTTTSRT